MASIRLKLVYDGAGPVSWCRDPRAFGVQDKEGVLHVGAPGPGGVVIFDLTLQTKSDSSPTPVFLGSFVHGPPAARFLYLGWRDVRGAFAQRLKLPLASITWNDVRAAEARQQPLVGTLVDHHPRATTTGANIGGTRVIDWVIADGPGA